MQKCFLECACKTPRHKRTPRDKRAEPEKNTPPQTYISRKSLIFLRDFSRFFCEITPPQANDFAKVRFESASSGFPTPMISQNGGTSAELLAKCVLREENRSKSRKTTLLPDPAPRREKQKKSPVTEPRRKHAEPDKNAPPQY